MQGCTVVSCDSHSLAKAYTSDDKVHGLLCCHLRNSIDDMNGLHYCPLCACQRVLADRRLCHLPAWDGGFVLPNLGLSSMAKSQNNVCHETANALNKSKAGALADPFLCNNSEVPRPPSCPEDLDTSSADATTSSEV